MKLRICILAGLLTAATSLALYADWIVTRQGESFEIKGALQLKGRLVVFNLPDGTLSSMRADRVDLEASQRRTQRVEKDKRDTAARAASTEPDIGRSKRKAVIVLTDKDFRKTLPPGPVAAPAAPPDIGKAGTAAKSNQPATSAPDTTGKQSAATREVPNAVEIVTFNRVPLSESKTDGLEIKGTLRNKSQEYLTRVLVEASFFDDAGTFITRLPATVENQVLPPTESSTFTVAANGIFSYATIRWDIHAIALQDLQGGKATAAPAKPQSR